MIVIAVVLIYLAGYWITTVVATALGKEEGKDQCYMVIWPITLFAIIVSIPFMAFAGVAERVGVRLRKYFDR